MRITFVSMNCYFKVFLQKFPFFEAIEIYFFTQSGDRIGIPQSFLLQMLLKCRWGIPQDDRNLWWSIMSSCSKRWRCRLRSQGNFLTYIHLGYLKYSYFLLIIKVKCFAFLFSSKLRHLRICSWQNLVEGFETKIPKILCFYNSEIWDRRCIILLFWCWFDSIGKGSEGVAVNILFIPIDFLVKVRFCTSRSLVGSNWSCSSGEDSEKHRGYWKSVSGLMIRISTIIIPLLLLPFCFWEDK